MYDGIYRVCNVMEAQREAREEMRLERVLGPIMADLWGTTEGIQSWN